MADAAPAADAPADASEAAAPAVDEYTAPDAAAPAGEADTGAPSAEPGSEAPAAATEAPAQAAAAETDVYAAADGAIDAAAVAADDATAVAIAVEGAVEGVEGVADDSAAAEGAAYGAADDSAATGAAAPKPAARSSLRIALPANPVPELQFLTYYSWWTELGTKRYVEICFDMQTELFQITLDKDVQHLKCQTLFNPTTESLREVTAKDTKVMSMHLHEKLSDNQHADSLRQNHLNQWDLHVGARINILGRPTTLMQCNLLTTQWLEYQTARLTRIKLALEDQLRKYETNPILAVFATKPRPKGKVNGTSDLRFLLNMIEGLAERLKRYRPSIAESIQAMV